jgi:histidyl-tRNA synthetase
MIEAVKGARDILPAEIERWQHIEEHARMLFALYGFSEIRTPIFEHTELFQRGIGESTDIVTKEMYTFADRKGRSLTLRPENTAPVVRAYVQHQLRRDSDVCRLYYMGPMFRYERPQKGRMRQFYQIGVEALGSDHPAIDAETLEMLMAFLAEIGLQRLRLVLNSVGCPECRPRYRETLVRFLKPLLQKLCDDCQRRLETNPLRCFDCKIPADRELMGRAPAILESLCQTCRDHFDLVRSYLESFGVEYAIDPRLVRGLDYYRRTAFEVLAPELGAQNSVLGGGRYDGLSEEIGGPPVPGFGFAVGEDRLVMMLQGNAPHQRQAPDLFIAALSEAGVARALPLARTVRRARKRVLLEPLPHKSLKSQMRRANDVGARFVLMIGDQELDSGELTLKRMADGAQERIREGDLVSRIEALTDV